MKWLVAQKEIIGMFANIAVAVAAVWILITLRLQKQATQTAMFSDIIGRISSILGETPDDKSTSRTQYNWSIRLLNELEAFVFLSNTKLISSKMEEYYRGGITAWIEALPKNYPDAIKEIRAEQGGAYKILDEYYFSIKGFHASLFE